MRFIKYSRAAVLALTTALAGLLSGPAQADDRLWEGDVDLDYGNASNWEFDFFVPNHNFDEVAVINNGDAVFLATPLTMDSDKPAGLSVGGGSSLEIQNGGSLEVLPGTMSPPDSAVRFPGNVDITLASLVVRSGGSLSASGTANLFGITRLVGPSATFSAGKFELRSSHTLTAEITSPTDHSPLSSPGNVFMAGSLVLEFNGVSPQVGSSWPIIDAATVSGGFGSVIAPSLPLGQRAVMTTASGGLGKIVSATIANQLVLSINAATGATTIRNLSASTSEVIDGYSITAASGALNADGWLSFAEAGQPGWEEANTAANHLSELNLDGSRTIGPGSIDLGTAYAPPTQFGASPAPVHFTYHAAGGQTLLGAVKISANTLVLQVDPATGQSQIVNPSGFDVNIDGYSILSASGSLDSNGWTPVADSDANWEEANGSSKHLSELNLNGARSISKLEGTGPIALGSLFTGGEQDLTFRFHLAGGSVDGDYNVDGGVDAADYVLWRKSPGDFGGETQGYMKWQANFGKTGGGPSGTFVGDVQYVSLSGGMAAGSSHVPEPSTGILTGLAVLCIALTRRKKRIDVMGMTARCC